MPIPFNDSRPRRLWLPLRLMVPATALVVVIWGLVVLWNHSLVPGMNAESASKGKIAFSTQESEEGLAFARGGTPGQPVAAVKPGKNEQHAGQVRPRCDWGRRAKIDPPPLHTRTVRELFDDLLQVREVSIGLDDDKRKALVSTIKSKQGAPAGDTKAPPAAAMPGLEAESKGEPVFIGQFMPIRQSSTLVGLPLNIAHPYRLDDQEVKELLMSARKLRKVWSLAVGAGNGASRDNVDLLRDLLGQETFEKGAARAFPQLLDPESEPVREYLIEVLDGTPGAAASHTLAQMAVTDLSPSIRSLARATLKKRPTQAYQPVLISYLNYPWPAAATHAAQALEELDATEAIPALICLLGEPDPAAPRAVVLEGVKQQVIPELVKLNHLKSCVICHAVSTHGTTIEVDDVTLALTASVPSPGQPVQPALAVSPYQADSNLFVRPDIIYLRQDFSVVQPEPRNGLWPAFQRFDFVVRLAPISDPWAGIFTRRLQRRGSPQRQALLHALRHLTGRDLGLTFEDWQPLLASASKGPGGHK